MDLFWLLLLNWVPNGAPYSISQPHIEDSSMDLLSLQTMLVAEACAEDKLLVIDSMWCRRAGHATTNEASAASLTGLDHYALGSPSERTMGLHVHLIQWMSVTPTGLPADIHRSRHVCALL